MDQSLQQTQANWPTCRKFTIINKTPEQMKVVLGEPNIEDDASKVVHSWQVEQESTDRKLAVWDYYNSHLEGYWSGWGDIDLAIDLFGIENIQ